MPAHPTGKNICRNCLLGFQTFFRAYCNFVGNQRSPPQQITLPADWEWIDSDWKIDANIEGGIDKEGWQYAINWRREWYNNIFNSSFTRRRKWIRARILKNKNNGEKKISSIISDFTKLSENEAATIASQIQSSLTEIINSTCDVILSSNESRSVNENEWTTTKVILRWLTLLFPFNSSDYSASTPVRMGVIKFDDDVRVVSDLVPSQADLCCSISSKI